MRNAIFIRVIFTLFTTFVLQIFAEGEPLPIPVYVEIYNVKNTSFEVMWELIDTKMVTGFKIFESTTGKLYEVGSNKRLNSLCKTFVICIFI